MVSPSAILTCFQPRFGTLTAALAHRGWRLLSDEFGLVRPERGDLLPMPRAIPLKNTSIEAILEFDPAAPLGPTYPKTRKGRVRHVRASDDSQRRQHELQRRARGAPQRLAAREPARRHDGEAEPQPGGARDHDRQVHRPEEQEAH